MRTRWISLIVLVSLALGGCGSSQAAVEGPADVAPLNPQNTPSRESGSIPVESSIQSDSTPAAMATTPSPADLNSSVNLAKQELAGRLKIEVDQISLIKSLEITWPDISMGCNPGAGQILQKGERVYGYRIWLGANGDEYIYHVGGSGQVIPCPAALPGANNPLLATPDDSVPAPQNPMP